MLEKTIEKYLKGEIEKRGATSEKFTSPGKRHVPDQLVSVPGGLVLGRRKAWVFFVEVKKEGEKPTAGQARDHERRRAMGFNVYVVDSKHSVDRMIKVVFGW